MVLQAFCGMLRLAEPAGLNKKSRNITSVRYENWRQPTLAQAIQALPSARLCLTAEFGMGSGRTTALWPPRNVLVSCPLYAPANGHTPNGKDHRLFDTNATAHSTDHGARQQINRVL